MLSCGDQEGTFVALSVSGHFLVAGTDCGFVKMWDLSRRYMYMYILYVHVYMYVNTACNAHIVYAHVFLLIFFISILCVKRSKIS